MLIPSFLAISLTSAVPLIIFFLLRPLLEKKDSDGGGPPLLLTILVATAAGCLLGDVFFHLIPEIFELRGDYMRKCVLIFCGIFAFFVGERVLQHYHHGHGLSHIGSQVNAMGSTFSLVRSSPEETNINDIEMEAFVGLERCEEISPNDTKSTTQTSSVKPVGLLILTSDFVHNFVDGLAIGVSFSTSFSVGIATSMAVFLHEIPHELGDFAILLNAGYSPSTIVLCNILTTISSFMGVIISTSLIFMDSSVGEMKFTSTLKPGILSLTAGNFLYIALADLIPELFQKSEEASIEKTLPSWISSFIIYFAFMMGALSMLFIKLLLD